MLSSQLEMFTFRILTQTEWDSMPKGQLDQGVTDFKRNVCEPVVLHCL